MSLRFALFVALVLPACIYPPDPSYCPGKNPNNNCLSAGLDPGPVLCTTSAECSGPTPVCDLGGTQMCVACTPGDAGDAGACTGSTPICGDDRACHGCTEHTECGAGLCLPDGSCGDDARVAYVDPSGDDNLVCTSAAPCQRVSLALATGRPYVKLAGVIDEPVVVRGGQVVTFIGGPDVKLTRFASGPGPILTVRDESTSLTIYDLSISDAPPSSDGIGLLIPHAGWPDVTLVRTKISNNPGGGIVQHRGALTVTQSLISSNAGGGISVDYGTFTIIGNMFHANGNDGPSAFVGGLLVTTPWTDNRLEFNSFHKNVARSGIGAALHCSSSFAAVAARNNIMSENGMADQIGGDCTHAYSIVRPGPLPLGIGNTSADPLFVNPAIGDLHVRPESPARGAADPSSSLTGIAERDLDGDVRTSPADIGADEVP